MGKLLDAVRKRVHPVEIERVLIGAEAKEVEEALVAVVTRTSYEDRLDDVYSAQVLLLLLAKIKRLPAKFYECLVLACDEDLLITVEVLIKHAYHVNNDDSCITKWLDYQIIAHSPKVTKFRSQLLVQHNTALAKIKWENLKEELNDDLASVVPYYHARAARGVFWGVSHEHSMSLLEKVRNSSSRLAMLYRGHCYLTGTGVTRDFLRAIECYEKCDCDSTSLAILDYLQQGDLVAALQVCNKDKTNDTARDLVAEAKQLEAKAAAATAKTPAETQLKAAESKEVKAELTVSSEVKDAAGLALIRICLQTPVAEASARKANLDKAREYYKKLSETAQKQAEVEHAALEMIKLQASENKPVVSADYINDIFRALNIREEVQRSPALANYLIVENENWTDAVVFTGIATLVNAFAQIYREKLRTSPENVYFALTHALSGRSEGQIDLGMNLALGLGHAQDEMEAVHWLTQATLGSQSAEEKHNDVAFYQLMALANNTKLPQGHKTHWSCISSLAGDALIRQCLAFLAAHEMLVKLNISRSYKEIILSFAKNIPGACFFTAWFELKDNNKLFSAIENLQAAVKAESPDIRFRAVLELSKVYRTRTVPISPKRSFEQLEKLILQKKSIFFCYAFLQELQAIRELVKNDKQLLAKIAGAQAELHLQLAQNIPRVKHEQFLRNCLISREARQAKKFCEEMNKIAEECKEDLSEMNKRGQVTHLAAAVLDATTRFSAEYQQKDKIVPEFEELADKSIDVCLILIEYFKSGKINIAKLEKYYCLVIKLAREQKMFPLINAQLSQFMQWAKNFQFKEVVAPAAPAGSMSLVETKRSEPETAAEGKAYNDCLLAIGLLDDKENIFAGFVAAEMQMLAEQAKKEQKTAEVNDKFFKIMAIPLCVMAQGKVALAAKDYLKAAEYFNVVLKLLTKILDMAVWGNNHALEEEVMRHMPFLARLIPPSEQLKARLSAVDADLKSKVEAKVTVDTHKTMTLYEVKHNSPEFSQLTKIGSEAKSLQQERIAVQDMLRSSANYRALWDQFHVCKVSCYGFKIAQKIIDKRIANNDLRRALLAIMCLIAKFPDIWQKKDFLESDLDIIKKTYPKLTELVQGFAKWRNEKFTKTTNADIGGEPLYWIFLYLNRAKQCEHKDTFLTAMKDGEIFPASKAKNEIARLDKKAQVEIAARGAAAAAVGASLAAGLGAGAAGSAAAGEVEEQVGRNSDSDLQLMPLPPAVR